MTFIELLDSESDLLWTFAFPCFMGLIVFCIWIFFGAPCREPIGHDCGTNGQNRKEQVNSQSGFIAPQKSRRIRQGPITNRKNAAA